MGTKEAPKYTLTSPATRLQMHVELPTSQIRPYVLCAMLRDCTFSERSYNSFLDLQVGCTHVGGGEGVAGGGQRGFRGGADTDR